MRHILFRLMLGLMILLTAFVPTMPAFGSPQLPSVTTDNATNVTTNSARLNGNLTALGSASSANVSFQWGTSSGNYTANTTAQTVNTTGAFYFDLTSLTVGTTHYFMAKAAVGDNISYGGEKSFTTLTPPAVTTDNATNVTTNSARLNGNLTALGTASSANVSFEWGTSSGAPYPNETSTQTVNATGAFYFDLGGLSSGTTHYFRAKAVGDNTSYGSEKSFTTLTPPAVTTNDASNVTTNSARLNGNLTSRGTALSVDVSFEWGTSSGNYTANTTAQTVNATGAFYFDLGGLSSGTTHYFRAKAVGDNTSYGGEKSFTTLTPTPPAVISYGGPLVPPPPPPVGITDVSGSVDEDGIFTEEVTTESEDGKVELTIEEGTTGLVEKKPLSEISIARMKEPPDPPAGAGVIGLTYNLGPDGAIFDPPITLTFTYDPDKIPVGVNEEDLVLAMWDENVWNEDTGEWGAWVVCECTCDPETNCITACICHFTAFAILSARPAAFSTSALSISPAEVDIGESVTITALVTNTGGITDRYTVTLKINGVVVATKDVTVEGGASKTVAFTTSRDVAGTYAVGVAGLSGTFSVREVVPLPALPPPPAPPVVVTAPAVPPPPVPAAPAVNWWLVVGIIATVAVIGGLLIYFLGWRRVA